MKISRRIVLHQAAGALALPSLSRLAWAQTYPTRPVRLVVGFSAGSASDIAARLIGQWLTERLGQPFIIENRPGAGGNIATQAVAGAAADGYTLLYASFSNAINAILHRKQVNYVFLRDIMPVASVASIAAVMEVHPSLPVQTVPEFIAYAKANSGKINVATVGPGSAQHLSAVLFMMMTGVEMVPVHYLGGAQALTDLIAGRVQAMFDIIVSSIGYIRSGQLRVLAVTTPTPWDTLPGVPTVGQFVPGYEAVGWHGIGAPRNTPVQIIEQVNREVNAALSDADFKARLAKLGGQPFISSPSEFGEFLAKETEKWGKVVDAANIKLN